MWLYRTSGCAKQSIVLYEYQPTRKAEHAEAFLKGFSGWLHADGYQGYHLSLIHIFGHILGVDEQHRLVVVGAGHLGHALLRNFDFMQTGFLLDTAFDVSQMCIRDRV